MPLKPTMEMPEAHRQALRKKCLRSLYSFCLAVMGYDDVTPDLHGEYCRFLEGPSVRKQATMPRSFVKTWIGSIAYPIWATLPRSERDEYPAGVDPNDKFYNLGPNMRVLIASYVISNAEKMISLIRKTYESNRAMQILFPEVIPLFNKTKWSNQSACVARTENFTESTFEAAGIGGASTSRHYDLIIEDDLIYAKKDDLTGQELQPNQEDIDKAVGWHKLATSLLVPGKHTRIHNTGTRWAKNDLIDYIWKNEPHYVKFVRACVDQVQLEALENKEDWATCDPTWGACFDIEQLEMIRRAQGPYMFSTQYLLLPISPEEVLFKPHWLQYYVSPTELPSNMRKFTTVDLAGWSKDKRSKLSRAVILTCGWCPKNHVWLLHYDVGRLDPSEVIAAIGRHQRLFAPEMVGVETVYYQESLVFFARKAMEDGLIPPISFRQMVPGPKNSKDLRIRALEPMASNLAVHCKPSHTDFITEFKEYVPNNDICRKDILDALAYQFRIARPGVLEPLDEKVREDYVYQTNMDEVLAGIFKRANPVDAFGNKLMNDPYGKGEFDDLLVRDPFVDEEVA